MSEPIARLDGRRRRGFDVALRVFGGLHLVDGYLPIFHRGRGGVIIFGQLVVDGVGRCERPGGAFFQRNTVTEGGVREIKLQRNITIDTE